METDQLLQATLFKKYTSIENSRRKKFVDKCFDSIKKGFCDDDFVVEEKAHGCNFAFYYDGMEIKTASRNAFLEDDGKNFNQSHLIKEKYADNIRTLYSLLGYDSYEKDRTTIRVVGELIGGSYKHPDVPKGKYPLSKIQKGVDYCPYHEYYAFDLQVLSSSSLNDETEEATYRTLVDKIEMNRLFEQAGLFYAKPLFRGTLDECLMMNNTFKSNIPRWLDLPEHPEDNIAEGKVIKPVNFTSLATGAQLILKDKAELFLEVANVPKKNKNSTIILSEKGKNLSEFLCSHVTENRLSNVLSKQADIGSNLHFICRLFTQDAFEDFQKDHKADWDSLSVGEKKQINKKFLESSMELVQENNES